MDYEYQRSTSGDLNLGRLPKAVRLTKLTGLNKVCVLAFLTNKCGSVTKVMQRIARDVRGNIRNDNYVRCQSSSTKEYVRLYLPA